MTLDTAFEAVKLTSALSEPDGFYAYLNSIQSTHAHRKVVLLRLPKSFPLEQLEGESIRLPDRERVPLLTDYELGRCREEPPVGLLVPASRGLAVQSVEEMWTVTTAAVPSSPRPPLGTVRRLDFDHDVDAARPPRPQPQDLRMNLSAFDMASVIGQSRKSRSTAKGAHRSCPSPKKAKQNK